MHRAGSRKGGVHVHVKAGIPPRMSAQAGSYIWTASELVKQLPLILAVPHHPYDPILSAPLLPSVRTAYHPPYSSLGAGPPSLHAAEPQPCPQRVADRHNGTRAVLQPPCDALEGLGQRQQVPSQRKARRCQNPGCAHANPGWGDRRAWTKCAPAR